MPGRSIVGGWGGQSIEGGEAGRRDHRLPEAVNKASGLAGAAVDNPAEPGKGTALSRARVDLEPQAH
jgi:hypothetical protein